MHIINNNPAKLVKKGASLESSVTGLLEELLVLCQKIQSSFHADVESNKKGTLSEQKSQLKIVFFLNFIMISGLSIRRFYFSTDFAMLKLFTNDYLPSFDLLTCYREFYWTALMVVMACVHFTCYFNIKGEKTYLA